MMKVLASALTCSAMLVLLGATPAQADPVAGESAVALCDCEKKKDRKEDVEKPAESTEALQFCEGGDKKKGKDTEPAKPAA